VKTSYLPQRPVCPSCSAKLDGVTDFEGDAVPSEGDITVCAYCQAVLVFGRELALRVACASDLESLDAEKKATLLRYRLAVIQL
jgi:hypothetical protein